MQVQANAGQSWSKSMVSIRLNEHGISKAEDEFWGKNAFCSGGKKCPLNDAPQRRNESVLKSEQEVVLLQKVGGCFLYNLFVGLMELNYMQSYATAQNSGPFDSARWCVQAGLDLKSSYNSIEQQSIKHDNPLYHELRKLEKQFGPAQRYYVVAKAIEGPLKGLESIGLGKSQDAVQRAQCIALSCAAYMQGKDIKLEAKMYDLLAKIQRRSPRHCQQTTANSNWECWSIGWTDKKCDKYDSWSSLKNNYSLMEHEWTVEGQDS